MLPNSINRRFKFEVLVINVRTLDKLRVTTHTICMDQSRTYDSYSTSHPYLLKSVF